MGGAGSSHQLVHGSFMREVYATIRTKAGRLVTVEFSAYRSAVVRYGERGSAMSVLREGNSGRVDDVGIEMQERTLTISTPEWNVTVSSKVKPSILKSTKCADGRCTLDVTIKPRFNPDKSRVAPHGLIAQSYDGDSVGVVGAIDLYKGTEFTTSAMGEGAIEGKASDYEMSDKFGTEFRFARFGKTSAAPRNVGELSGKKIQLNQTITAVELVA